MGNILSYLKWRGDICFSERGFCDADNLVLSALAYVDLAGIVPETGTGKTITVKEAAREYFRNKKDIKNSYGELLIAMAESSRFKQAKLSCYKEKKDIEEQTQYASMKIALGDGTYFLTFRGTDDSIVGWREDFCISYKVTPAQQEAVQWIADVMTEEDGHYRIGGHSKGGNLSVYAAVMCPDELKEKIISIYNNDGPGISDELLDQKKYKMVRGKIIRIIPGFCVIGMLFEPDITPLIIESSVAGILQHDILTWQIDGDGLRLRAETEEGCDFYNQVFHTWIESADTDQRETFTKEFFDALEAGGASTITEVANGGIDGFGTILLSIAGSESRTKIVIGKLLHSWFDHLKHMDFRNILKSQEGIRGIISIIAGIICMLVPEFAVQSIGIVITLFLFLWSGKKVLEYGLKEEMEQKKKKYRLIVYMILMSLALILATHSKAILISGNILLGVIFMAGAFRLVQTAIHKEQSQIGRIASMLGGIFLFLISCVAIVTPEQAFARKMTFIGSVFILYGFVMTILSTVKKSENKS